MKNNLLRGVVIFIHEYSDTLDMHSSKKNERKTLLVNSRFQLSILSYFVGASALVAGIFFAATRYFFQQLHARGSGLGLRDDHVFFKFVRDQQIAMDLILVGSSLVLLIGLLAFGLSLSHKIAGPIYRLVTDLNRAKDGTSVPIFTLRKDDYFPELAQAINEYSQAMSSKPNFDTNKNEAA